jgi:peptidoglycan/xylan/chitin deacetylase (PgdA/CDA1 family)
LPEPQPFSIETVRLSDFEKQIQFLSKIFRMITISQLLEEINSDTLQPNTICVTFDDGYRDNYLYAYPILKKYEVPATIFLATGAIGNSTLLWHDQVLRALRCTRLQNLEWPNGSNRQWPLDSVQSRLNFAFTFLASLKQKRPEKRDQEIANLHRMCAVDHTEPRSNEMLSWQDVRDMHENGIAFGAHTVTHPILSLLDEREITFEVSQSKQAIEKKLNTNIDVFAYPNGRPGDFDERVKQILKNCGFRCGLTTNWGMNSLAHDPFEWHRATPWESRANEFGARMILMRFFN